MSSSSVNKWKHAKSFQDLRNLNEEYLEGKLRKTPLQLAPLLKESNYIHKELMDLCRDACVLTIESQPRGIFNDPHGGASLRQRAYVEGVWRGSVEDFISRVRPTGLLYMVQRLDNRYVHKMSVDDVDGRWGFTKYCDGRVRTGLYVKYINRDCITELKFYNNRHYSVTSDHSLVFFVVAEPTWPTDEDPGEHGSMFRILREALI